MSQDIKLYNASQTGEDKKICNLLMKEINAKLPTAESKVWHRHPVWFLDGNPVVGYAKRKVGVQMLFWSGQSFEEEGLSPEGSFKVGDICYTSSSEIKLKDLHRWLLKSKKIQWDYKNIVKRKGRLERLK